MNNFLKPSYWFTLQPAQVDGLSAKILFAVLVLVVILGIISKIVASHKKGDPYRKQLEERVGSLLITTGFLGLLFAFFSYERVSLFGARFWYVLLVIGFLVWVFFLARFSYRTIPQMKDEEQKRADHRKYFPPRRKK